MQTERRKSFLEQLPATEEEKTKMEAKTLNIWLKNYRI